MNPRCNSRHPALGLSSALIAALLASACSPTPLDGSPGAGGSSSKGGTSGGTAGTGGSGTPGSGSAGTAAAGTTGGPGSGSSGSFGTAGTSGDVGGTGGTGTGGTSTGTGGSGTAGTGPARGGTGGGAAGSTPPPSGGATGTALPDPGSDGDGDSKVGPTYTTQADLGSKGNPKGKSFSVSVTSKIFDGKDSTLKKTYNTTRTVQVYVPAAYKDGTPAPMLVIQDGPGEITQVSNALDNLTISTDPMRKLPAFVVIAVPNGGDDSIGSERGLEYDTMSDRYARYVNEEVMPAVQDKVKAMYPNFKFDPNGSGRAALGCSSGAAAAFTMAWFRPDLFTRVIAYSATLVAQQDSKSAEAKLYPDGAWDYHSNTQVIMNDKTGREKMVRIFHNANENDNGATAAESGKHNWLMAGTRTAAALKAKGFHYQFVEGMGQGHCGSAVQSATLADALVWVWRGYQPPAM